jgi:hypothetical protein
MDSAYKVPFWLVNHEESAVVLVRLMLGVGVGVPVTIRVVNSMTIVLPPRLAAARRVLAHCSTVTPAAHQ